MRRQVLMTYIHFNILDSQIFDCLIRHNSIKVREYFMSLINNMVSDYQGRSYLLARPNIITILVEMMMIENADSYFRQNLLGTL
jgi:hypothetical protein